jgi:hypothetical protein
MAVAGVAALTRDIDARQPTGKKAIMSQHAFHESVQHRRPNGLSSVAVSQRVYADAVSNEAIAKRAYEKFTARGHVHGFDREDWAEAREELIAEEFGE